MWLNEASWDRIARVILGLGLVGFYFSGSHSVWWLLGLLPLVTGAVGFCPLYKLVGLSTCPSSTGAR